MRAGSASCLEMQLVVPNGSYRARPIVAKGNLVSMDSFIYVRSACSK